MEGYRTLKCDGCGTPLKLLVDDTLPRQMMFFSDIDVCELQSVLAQISEAPRPIITLADAPKPEIVKIDNPYEGWLRCPSCGLIYEKEKE